MGSLFKGKLLKLQGFGGSGGAQNSGKDEGQQQQQQPEEELPPWSRKNWPDRKLRERWPNLTLQQASGWSFLCYSEATLRQS